MGKLFYFYVILGLRGAFRNVASHINEKALYARHPVPKGLEMAAGPSIRAGDQTTKSSHGMECPCCIRTTRKAHQTLDIIRLHAWKLSSSSSERWALQNKLQERLKIMSGNPQSVFIKEMVNLLPFLTLDFELFDSFQSLYSLMICLD